MLRTCVNVRAAVLLVAAASGIAKTPKCTPRRKECRDPRARCIANALAEGCTGSRRKCRREAKRACRAEIAGKTGDPGLAYVEGYAVSPVGLGYGLSCYSESSPVPDCAEHLDAGTGWQFRAVSYKPPEFDVPYELKSWTTPCTGGPAPGENLCRPNGFIIPTADVCVLATFGNPSGAGLPDKTIPEGTCPTGPGDG